MNKNKKKEEEEEEEECCKWPILWSILSHKIGYNFAQLNFIGQGKWHEK
jgi:hypothetical protein